MTTVAYRVEIVAQALHDIRERDRIAGQGPVNEDADWLIERLAEAGYSVVKTEAEWEYAQVGGCTEAEHCHGPHIGLAPDGQWLHSEMGTASYRRRVYRAGPWEPVPEGGDDV